jgi:hypothetical protein
MFKSRFWIPLWKTVSSSKKETTAVASKTRNTSSKMT